MYIRRSSQYGLTILVIGVLLYGTDAQECEQHMDCESCLSSEAECAYQPNMPTPCAPSCKPVGFSSCWTELETCKCEQHMDCESCLSSEAECTYEPTMVTPCAPSCNLFVFSSCWTELETCSSCGSCYLDHDVGCSIPTVEECVCDLDDFCCAEIGWWDYNCVDLAYLNCNELCGGHTPVCIDEPPNWADTAQDTCAIYERAQYCTNEGEPGAGWDETYGIFGYYAVNGVDASQACCACGGGHEYEGEGCVDGLHECGDGLCIDESLVCDGEVNCSDASDEPASCVDCDECSARTCEFLGLDPDDQGTSQVCGESSGGDLGGCSGAVTPLQATVKCLGAGMRLCTVDELERNEVAETGCGYDFDLVWSSTNCDGSSSMYWAAAGEHGQGPLRACMSSDDLAVTRCCADVDLDVPNCCVG